MHSALTFRNSRLCSTWTVSQASAQKRQLVRHRPARHAAPFTTCTSSYVDHVDQHLHSSTSRGTSSTVAADDTADVTGSRRRARLDESLPYVAVLRARKEHKHPVQEKQRALGKTEVCPFAAHQHGITAVRSSLTERWQPCSRLHEVASKPVLCAGCQEDRATG